MGDFVVEEVEEGVAEFRGGKCFWGLEQLPDGGEESAGVSVGAVDEGGEVSRFISQKCVTVGGDVEFVGFGVDSEVGFIAQSFQLTAGLLHGAELGGIPGG